MELYNSSKYMRYLIHLFHDEPLVLEIIGLVLCASSFWPGLPESVGQKGPWAGWFLGKCRRGWRTGKVPQKPLAGRGVTYVRLRVRTNSGVKVPIGQNTGC